MHGAYVYFKTEISTIMKKLFINYIKLFLIVVHIMVMLRQYQ